MKCSRTITDKQAIKMVWKAKRKSAIVCPHCFGVLQGHDIKNLTVSEIKLRQSFLWQKGIRELDIKWYLSEWTKQQKEQL